MRWRDLGEAMLAALFAAPCPLCAEGGAGGRLCSRCLDALPRLASVPSCTVCAEPMAAGAVGLAHAGGRCGACLDGRAFTRVVALGHLEAELKELVHQLKFGGRRSLASGLGEAAARELGAAIGPVDAVVAIPLGKKREAERGYNQAEAVARGVARALGAALERRWLERVRETRPQTELTRAQRRDNVRGAFRAPGVVRGKRLLLVDDVMTTGATLEEGARALLRAGAAEVVVLVLARASRAHLGISRHLDPSLDET